MRAMARALLIIDIQRDYFEGGAYPLVGPDAADTDTILEG
jgi:nicotinamidase-related amidase